MCIKPLVSDKIITFTSTAWGTKYHPGKPVLTAPGHFNLPNGPFEVWQIDFLQLSLYHRHWYVLVMICMFLTALKLFLIEKLMPLQWLKYFQKRLFPLGELLSNSIVTGRALQQVCAIWPILLHFHCAYQPRSSGWDKHTNALPRFDWQNL